MVKRGRGASFRQERDWGHLLSMGVSYGSQGVGVSLPGAQHIILKGGPFRQGRFLWGKGAEFLFGRGYCFI